MKGRPGVDFRFEESCWYVIGHGIRHGIQKKVVFPRSACFYFYLIFLTPSTCTIIRKPVNET